MTEQSNDLEEVLADIDDSSPSHCILMADEIRRLREDVKRFKHPPNPLGLTMTEAETDEYQATMADVLDCSGADVWGLGACVEAWMMGAECARKGMVPAEDVREMCEAVEGVRRSFGWGCVRDGSEKSMEDAVDAACKAAAALREKMRGPLMPPASWP